MCSRASTGISVLILNKFSSMEGEGVSAYAKARLNYIIVLNKNGHGRNIILKFADFS